MSALVSVYIFYKYAHMCTQIRKHILHMRTGSRGCQIFSAKSRLGHRLHSCGCSGCWSRSSALRTAACSARHGVCVWVDECTVNCYALAAGHGRAPCALLLALLDAVCVWVCGLMSALLTVMLWLLATVERLAHCCSHF